MAMSVRTVIRSITYNIRYVGVVVVTWMIHCCACCATSAVTALMNECPNS